MTSASKKLVGQARPLFIEFMARDGYDRKDAAWEFDNVLTCNGVPVIREYYLTVFRKGAPMTVTRAARVFIFETFNNSLNHAAFAGECNQLQQESV